MEQLLPLAKGLWELPASPFLPPEVQIQNTFPQASCIRTPEWSGVGQLCIWGTMGPLPGKRQSSSQFTQGPFSEGLWEMSLLPAMGPVDTNSQGCAECGEAVLCA